MTKYSMCKCGCGREVTNEKNKFISGHNTKGSKQSEITILKRKQTLIDKYGVENAMKSKELITHFKEGMIKKYGVDHPSKVEDIQNKKKQTCLENYGVEYPGQSDEVKEKSKQTCLKNYGVEYPTQSEKVRIKIKKICLDRFGFDNFAKTFQARQIYREKHIKMIEDQKLNGEPLMPCIGILERECFNELQKTSRYIIDKPKESIIGYFPDGYIKELNLIIEFYENWHQRNCFKEKDIQRQKDLITHLNCKFFIIHEKDWLNNKDQIINQFKILISEGSING